MKQVTTKLVFLLFAVLFSGITLSQGTEPEILYYKFNQAGTTVNNDALTPPAGTNTATLMGGMTQGGNGLCQTGLIGTGGISSSDYVSTGWDTNLGTGSWTIAFWTDNIPSSSTLFYQFGDPSAGSFRCFTNGVAGSGNFMLRGPVTDVTCTGCAPIGAPSMTVFVYDSVAGDIKAYHDGVLNATVPQGALNITGGAFTVGGYNTNTGLAAGQIMDEFRFYDRALDAQEVFDTYNACLPLTSSPDDAGISSIDGPMNFCEGTEDVVVTIRNYGINQIDSVKVNWTINGAPQAPYNHIGLIDTVGGTLPYTAQVTLGSYNFVAGLPTVIEAWTIMPNGVTDTVTSNDSTMAIVQPSLAGNFTIGGTTPDYPDFSTAVADLNAFGVCGPVIFDVRTGVYTEQVNLGAINGASGANTITFRSEAGHRDSVLLTFASTLSNDNYTFKFSGADHVNLEQMSLEATGATYGHVMEFGGLSDSNTVWDCAILGGPSTTTSTNRALLYSSGSKDNYNSFIENTFEGGSYSAYWYGDGTTSLEQGTLFEGNEFLEAYYSGLRLYYQDSPTVTKNRLAMNSPYTSTIYGYYLTYCDNAFIFTDNSAVVGPDNYGYGAYVSNCDGAPGNSGLFANNMLSVGNPLSTSTSYGIYMTNNSRMMLTNNSVFVKSDGTSSRAFYATGGGLNELINNSFVTEGPGYAAYFASNYTLSNSDYNNYYTTGSNLAYFNGDQPDLASLQAVTGLNANSISVDPVYQSFEDLHVCSDSLNAAGTPIASVTMDIDGAPRDGSTPDIGADEFGPLSGNFLGADLLICTNETLTLWAGAPADTILWSTGDTTMSLDVTTPGTYYVDVMSACGTTGSDTIVVTQSNLVYNNFISADTTFFCLPNSATLTSTQVGTSYDWSTSETTQSINVTTGGTYILNVTDECGSGVDSITIVGATTPVPSYTTTTSYVTAFFTNTSTADGTVTYDWDFGDGNSSNLENPTHVYTAAGTYQVTLTVSNQCGTATYSDSVTLTTVGLDEIGDGNSLSIYPNPNNGSFTLDISLLDNADVKVMVTNELGQAIYSNKLGEVTGNSSEMIDLGTVESGLYFITVIVDENPYTSKFIVK
ncbi:MAG: PKD domain-containing protein [Flavobacteriales bacterium]|nr:PKD domain-containing protein [Flavobacteriales bacterium]